jgi:error-prone DNA polymerase
LLEKAQFDPDRIERRHAEMRDLIKSAHAVRLGFRSIKGLPEEKMARFVARRGSGYESVRDVWLRSGLDVDEIEKLAQADAFRSIGLDRRGALWAVRALDAKSAAELLPLFDQPQLSLRDLEPKAHLPVMPLGEHVIHDYRSLGLSLKAHPMSFLRDRFRAAGITANADLPLVKNGRRVTVAGLVLVRQRPGKGNAIFLTLEDEKAIANVIIWQRKFEAFRPIVMGSKLIKVTGKLQCESGVIHIVAEQMSDLSHWLAVLSEKASNLNALAHADEVKRGIDHDQRRIRKQSRHIAPATILPEELHHNDETLRQTVTVMPKGRNFH